MWDCFVTSVAITGSLGNLYDWDGTIIEDPLDARTNQNKRYSITVTSQEQKFGILIEISLKFVPEGPINNHPLMV